MYSWVKYEVVRIRGDRKELEKLLDVLLALDLDCVYKEVDGIEDMYEIEIEIEL